MGNVLQRNNVTVTGKGGKVILFAHGFGCDQNSWKYIKDNFAADHTIILFDYIGAGRSDIRSYDPKKYAALEGYASDILEICAVLELKDIILIAHSVSSIIGALAAIKNPGLFKKLVFIGPSPCYINKEDYKGGFEKEEIDSLLEVMEEDYISWAQSLAPVIMNKENGPGLGQELTDTFCSMDKAIGKDFAKVTFLSDNRKDLAHIPVESLTIQCSDDSIAPLYVGQYIHEKTPRNTLIVLKAYGHCPHMSHPAETIAAIRSYI